jgi:hypothetical protein
MPNSVGACGRSVTALVIVLLAAQRCQVTAFSGFSRSSLLRASTTSHTVSQRYGRSLSHCDSYWDSQRKISTVLLCLGGKDNDNDGLVRRAFLATTLAPLASVSLVYLAVPSLLSKTTRDADWYKSNFAEKMAGVCLSACYS